MPQTASRDRNPVSIERDRSAQFRFVALIVRPIFTPYQQAESQ